MHDPELLAALTHNRQSIIDSGRRIAVSLIGKDEIDHAFAMEELELSAHVNMTDEEHEQYQQGEPWVKLAEDRDEDPHGTLDELIHRPSSFVSRHAQVLDVVEQAPLIAVTKVKDVGGFVLSEIVPCMTGVPLETAADQTEGFYMLDEGQLIRGASVISRRVRTLKVTLGDDLIDLSQRNRLFRSVMLPPGESSDERNARMPEIPPAEAVPAELEVHEISDYLARYATAIRSMEILPADALKREIEPHLTIGSGYFKL